MNRVIAATVIALAMLAGGAGIALAGSAPTRLTFSAPARATLGERVTVQARLVDAQGEPISGATIAIVAPLRFLNGGGDVVLWEGRAEKNGNAVGSFEARVVGPLALRAVFRGDQLYAPAEALAELKVVEGATPPLYRERVGVHLPGLNEPPGFGQVALIEPQDTVISRALALWPAMSGWPIAGALIVIWSVYASVVRLLFRIAAAPSGTPR